jgi:hypothetical protein
MDGIPMNEKLKNIRNKEFDKYRQTMLSAPPAIVHFDAGFQAAIPHIRQDERERVLKVVFDIQKKFGYGDKDFPEVVTDELKKMDEVNKDE